MESSLSNISVDSRAAIVLVGACLRVAISFLRALDALSAACVAKFFAWLVRRVSIICISSRTIVVPFATASSTILLMSFFASPLDGAFSMASTVLASAVFISLKPSLLSSSSEGLEIPSKLFGWRANSTYLLQIL